jgi:hypothetical protein
MEMAAFASISDVTGSTLPIGAESLTVPTLAFSTWMALA